MCGRPIGASGKTPTRAAPIRSKRATANIFSRMNFYAGRSPPHVREHKAPLMPTGLWLIGYTREAWFHRAGAPAELIKRNRDQRDDRDRHAEPHPLVHHVPTVFCCRSAAYLPAIVAPARPANGVK